MEQALEIFVNGIGGVFAGMAMLYFAIKMLALVVDRKPEGKEE